MLYGGPGQDGTGLQVINNTDLQQRGQAGSWGQMALVSSFGSSSGMVRGSGGLQLAKTEEAAAGVGSPFPCGSILPQSQVPPGQGRRMGDGDWGKLESGLLGPGSEPEPSGRAGPEEQVS